MNWLRDWWRGYSDEDVISACRKLLTPPTGVYPIVSWPELNSREYKAFREEGITREYAQRLLKQYEGK